MIVDFKKYAEQQAVMAHSPSITVRVARALISDSRLWTQGARARTELGRKVRPNHPEACQWSIAGALAVASNSMGLTPPALLQYMDQCAQHWGLVSNYTEIDKYGEVHVVWDTIDDFNDIRPHYMIMDFMDAVAASLQEAGY